MWNHLGERDIRDKTPSSSKYISTNFVFKNKILKLAICLLIVSKSNIYKTFSVGEPLDFSFHTPGGTPYPRVPWYCEPPIISPHEPPLSTRKGLLGAKMHGCQDTWERVSWKSGILIARALVSQHPNQDDSQNWNIISRWFILSVNRINQPSRPWHENRTWVVIWLLSYAKPRCTK